MDDEYADESDWELINFMLSFFIVHYIMYLPYYNVGR